MPRFPEKETDIIALAESLWRGLLSNRLVYPKPPTHSILVRMRARVYRNRRDTMLARQAKAESTITAKNEALEDLIEALKSNIRYAENTINFDDAKLKFIGWSGQKNTVAFYRGVCF